MSDQVINRRKRNMSQAPAYRMPEADLPDPPSAAQAAAEPEPEAEDPPAAELPRRPQITLSTKVRHRGRVITVTATDLTVDRFCDLLDAKKLESAEV